MSYLDFFSSIISSLAWPLALFFVVWALREELKGVLQALKIRRLKLKDFEAEFSESVETVDQEFSELQKKEIIKDEPVSAQSEKLLDVNPNYAVLESWKELESRVVDVSVGKFNNPRNWPVRRHIYDLVKREVIPVEIGSALEELNYARNQIVHSKEYKLERVSARKYIELVSDAIGFFNRLF